MDVYKCIRPRRTVREFKPDPVPEAIVQKILHAGRWEPRSSNTQPWHFVVVSARETIAALGRIATQGTFIGQAPLAIAIVMAHAGRPQLDAGRALQQMELMAWAEGLGTCFVGLRAAEQQDAIKALVGIPAEMELITVMPFGYRLEGRRAGGTPPQTDGRDRSPRTIWDRVCPPLSPRGRSTKDLWQQLADARMRSMAWSSPWESARRHGLTAQPVETASTIFSR